MRRFVRFVLIAACVIVGLGAVGLTCQRVALRGRYAFPYSTYGSGPEGARAAYLLAESLGVRPIRWLEDFGRAPPHGLLIALGGCAPSERTLSRVERKVLERWVRNGGVLVVAGGLEYLKETDLGLTLQRAEGGCSDPLETATGNAKQAEQRRDVGKLWRVLTRQDALPVERPARPKGALFEGMDKLAMRAPARIASSRPAQTQILLTRDGVPAAASTPIGQGRVLVFASASMFQNRDLARADGGVLLARILRRYASGRPVMFDEYHLGVGEPRSIARYIRELGGAPLVAQLLLVAMLLLWRAGARFGGSRIDPPHIPGGTASYLEALGNLFARTRDAAGSVRIIARHALVRVAAHHHLHEREPEAIARALERSGREVEAAAVRDLGEMLHLRDTHVRKLVGHARRADTLARTALEGKGSAS